MRKNSPNLTILRKLDTMLPASRVAAITPEQAMAASALGAGIDLGELGILRWVAVGQTRDSAWQTRDGYDDAHIQSIGESLDGQGLIEVPPARFWPEDPSIVEIGAGHCRTEAVRRGHNAGSNLPAPERFLEHMLFWIRPLSDLQMAAIAVDENAARENPNLMEQARGYKNLHAELKKQGLTDEQTPWDLIAERAKVSRRRVFQIASLLKLPDEAKKRIASREWNEKHGRAILDTEPENRELLMRQIAGKGLSGNQAVNAARELRKTHPTQRDLDLGVTVGKAVKNAKRTRAKIASQDNRAAVEAGNSPLQLVKGGAETPVPDAAGDAQKIAAELASAPQTTAQKMAAAHTELEQGLALLKNVQGDVSAGGELYQLEQLKRDTRAMGAEIKRIENELQTAFQKVRETSEKATQEVSSN